MSIKMRIELHCQKCDIKDFYLLKPESRYDKSVTVKEKPSASGRFEYIITNPDYSSFQCKKCKEMVDFYI